MTKKENINICFLAQSDSLSMDLVDMEFDEQSFKSFGDTEDEDESTDEGLDDKETKEEISDKSQESVSSKEENEEDTETPSSKESEQESKNVSSPKADVYSVTIQSLKDDGVLPDLDDKFIKTVNSPDKFIEAIEKQVEAKLDEQQRRIKEALDAGVSVEEVKSLEQTVQFLDDITTDKLEDEGQEGEELRKTLIYQDLLLKGFKEDKAKRAVEKAVADATDIEDAKDAYEALKGHYTAQYKEVIETQKQEKLASEKAQKEFFTDLQKMVLDTDTPFEGLQVDKKTRQKIYDNITKPTHKLEDGMQLTELQKYASENPKELSYYMGLFYTMTDGFKKLDKFIAAPVSKAKEKNIRNIEKLVETNKDRIGTSDFGVDEDLETFIDFKDIDV